MNMLEIMMLAKERIDKEINYVVDMGGYYEARKDKEAHTQVWKFRIEDGKITLNDN